MEINKSINEKEMAVVIKGRLDTVTAPDLEKELILDSVDSLVLDFKELEYISSAGLRVLLASQKVMAKKSGMVIINANKEIKEIFELTGFDSILTIK